MLQKTAEIKFIKLASAAGACMGPEIQKKWSLGQVGRHRHVQNLNQIRRQTEFARLVLQIGTLPKISVPLLGLWKHHPYLFP